MERLITTLGILIIFYTFLASQNPGLEIDGSVVLGNSNQAQPEAGTMRWTGADFEAFNGLEWVSLTGGKTAPAADADGNLYSTIKIGNQVWFVKNLRSSKYADGTPIPLVTDNGQWSGLSTGAYCWYDNNNIYDAERGKLYNWYAVNDTRGLCPAGWHVPSKMDFEELIAFLGGTNIAGGKMKQEGTSTWQDPNNGATNESGFTALGFGERYSSGSFSSFFEAFAPFWTSSLDGSEAYYLNLTNQLTSAIMFSGFGGNKKYGRTVRCLKD